MFYLRPEVGKSEVPLLKHQATMLFPWHRLIKNLTDVEKFLGSEICCFKYLKMYCILEWQCKSVALLREGSDVTCFYILLAIISVKALPS